MKENIIIALCIALPLGVIGYDYMTFDARFERNHALWMKLNQEEQKACLAKEGQNAFKCAAETLNARPNHR